jgi:hypothetical protein
MSHAAVEKPLARKVVCAPTHAQGSTFFAFMAGLWGAFVALVAASPTTLDDAYHWLTGLPLVWEILMWILTLPWTISYLVYQSSLQDWLRVLVVALIALVHLSITAPRAPAGEHGAEDTSSRSRA